jgi:hypothetical protein
MAEATTYNAGTAPSATRPPRQRARRGRKADLQRRLAALDVAIEDAQEELRAAKAGSNAEARWTTELHGRDYIDAPEGLLYERRCLRVGLFHLEHAAEFQQVAAKLGMSVDRLEDFDRLAALIDARYERKAGLTPDQNPGKAERNYDGLKLSKHQTLGSEAQGGMLR